MALVLGPGGGVFVVVFGDTVAVFVAMRLRLEDMYHELIVLRSANQVKKARRQF